MIDSRSQSRGMSSARHEQKPLDAFQQEGNTRDVRKRALDQESGNPDLPTHLEPWICHLSCLPVN